MHDEVLIAVEEMQASLTGMDQSQVSLFPENRHAGKGHVENWEELDFFCLLEQF